MSKENPPTPLGSTGCEIGYPLDRPRVSPVAEMRNPSISLTSSSMGQKVNLFLRSADVFESVVNLVFESLIRYASEENLDSKTRSKSYF